MKLDAKIKALAEKVIADGKNKRAIIVLKAMLEKGSITTDDLNDLGYNHPPRAVGDVRDAGIPIVTGSAISAKTGRRMAVYTFGDPSMIQKGRVGGRSALPKKFKSALVKRYGCVDCITGAELDERVLQIDHRIPYRIFGDAGLQEHNVEAYMLLDASSQRAKSWSCEKCANFTDTADPSICRHCFWAFPEDYDHIATVDIRRVDIVWQGEETATYDRLKTKAEKQGRTISQFIKSVLERS
jgi:hypothetical protein